MTGARQTCEPLFETLLCRGQLLLLPCLPCSVTALAARLAQNTLANPSESHRRCLLNAIKHPPCHCCHHTHLGQVYVLHERLEKSLTPRMAEQADAAKALHKIEAKYHFGFTSVPRDATQRQHNTQHAPMASVCNRCYHPRVPDAVPKVVGMSG